MLEQEDKEYIEGQIDFVLKNKEKRDTERILDLMKTIVASKSHSLYKYGANPFYSKLTGHIIRKDYRKELMVYAREYLRLKLDEK